MQNRSQNCTNTPLAPASLWAVRSNVPAIFRFGLQAKVGQVSYLGHGLGACQLNNSMCEMWKDRRDWCILESTWTFSQWKRAKQISLGMKRQMADECKQCESFWLKRHFNEKSNVCKAHFIAFGERRLYHLLIWSLRCFLNNEVL